MKKEIKKISLIIDGQTVQADAGTTVLEAAAGVGVKIPSLCWLKGISCPSSCRICVVEVEGAPKLLTSCSTPVREGMVVKTSTKKVLESRKINLELLLSNHSKVCLSCSKSTACELQRLSLEYDCDSYAIGGSESCVEVDDSHPCIVKDLSKCIQCNRCVAVCKRVQSVSAITKIKRGFTAKVGCANDGALTESTCVGCGQCTLVCPTGALMEKNDVRNVIEFLNNPELTVVAQVAPAVRVALAEEFGAPVGTFCETKIASALKLVGFNRVFDVNTGADFTVVEESNELIERVKSGKGLPMFSSCCPAWYKFVENFYPSLVPNLSTCKSPTEMLGALIKSFYANQKGIDPSKIKVVDIMPCTAKKGEQLRGDDIDACLTTRELAQLLRKKGIEFDKLPDGEFDSPLGEYSGAALIFGVSGGVTEAALRTAAKTITGKECEKYELNAVRGVSQGFKEAEIPLGNGAPTLKVAVVSGLANARRVLDDVIAGRSDYTFIEVMACPGGCINGGGQPYLNKNEVSVADLIKIRGGALYKKDKEFGAAAERRVSHANKSLINVYKDYLDKTPGLAHKLFHVHKNH